MDFKLRKLYSHKPKDGIDGNSIVTYRNIPWMMNHQGKTIQFRKSIVIDLWLFSIRFKWFSMIKKRNIR